MAIWTVTMKGYATRPGSGGSIVINKTLEMEDKAASAFLNGASRDAAIIDLVKTHYPGTIVDPKKIGVNVNPRQVNKSKAKNSSSFLAGAVGGLIASSISSASKDKKQPKTSPVKKDDNQERLFSYEVLHLSQIIFDGDETDTRFKLKEIRIGLKGYQWKFAMSDEYIIKQNNRALSQCLLNYERGLSHLIALNPSPSIVKRYQRIYKLLKLKKFLNKYWGLLLFVGLLGFLVIGGLLSS